MIHIKRLNEMQLRQYFGSDVEVDVIGGSRYVIMLAPSMPGCNCDTTERFLGYSRVKSLLKNATSIYVLSHNGCHTLLCTGEGFPNNDGRYITNGNIERELGNDLIDVMDLFGGDLGDVMGFVDGCAVECYHSYNGFLRSDWYRTIVNTDFSKMCDFEENVFA